MKGFWEGYGRTLFNWYGFVFTVLGTVVALVLVREYWWVSVLIIVAASSGSAAFAYQRQRDLQQAKTRHAEEESSLRQELAQLTTKAAEAERRLNSVPASILARMEAIIRSHSFETLSGLLVVHADYVERITTLTATISKRVSLKGFVKRAGQLYAFARLVRAAGVGLKLEDPFVLCFQSPDGLTTDRGIVIVHQYDLQKEIVWLRVLSTTGLEMNDLRALAEHQEVPGKGYSIRPLCDPSRYQGRNLVNLAATLQTLKEELLRRREVIP